MHRAFAAKIHNEELESCGFLFAKDDRKWDILKGLLIAKGLPEEYTAEGTPFKSKEVEDGVILEFGDG